MTDSQNNEDFQAQSRESTTGRRQASTAVAPTSEVPRPATHPAQYIVYWFKIFVQPLLAVSAVVAVILLIGWAQGQGWLTSADSAADSDNQVVDEDIEYVCPMLCVPPSKEPGRCPVCGMELKPRQPSGDSKDIYGIRIDPSSRRLANISTTTAVSMPLFRQIEAIGKIRYDESTLATISAYVDGRLEEMYADYTGVKVQKGDPLALIYSPDLYASQVALLQAKKAFEEGASTRSRIVESNRKFYESSRQRLIESGITEQQVAEIEQRGEADSRIRIVAPISGTVTDKLAVKGQYVKTGQVLYQVADLTEVWLRLELFPENAADMIYGQAVNITVQSQSDREFQGRVAFIDPFVDQKTQTISVRVIIPNEDGLIRVGDFAKATISVQMARDETGKRIAYDSELAGKWISPKHPSVISDGPGKCPICGSELIPTANFGFASAPLSSGGRVVVPRDAVLMAGGQSVAYVETEPGRFEFRRIKIGATVDDRVEILEGVAQGEKLAISAAFLIDSAFNMAGKPSLFDPSKAIDRDEMRMLDQQQMAKINKALQALSPDDRALAENQEICPVTKSALGSMGTPIKVEVDGTPIFICCEGCRGKLQTDPERYLAELEKARNELATQNPSSGELPQMALPEMALPQMELPQMKPPGDEPQTAQTGGLAEPSDEIVAALAKLSSQDRALAEKQRTCPVAGQPLGSMGTPIKVDVGGTAVFICCEGCRQRLLEKPQEYLAKLAKETSR